jgi:hypothetical protein
MAPGVVTSVGDVPVAIYQFGGNQPGQQDGSEKPAVKNFLDNKVDKTVFKG